ncbi:hypothetical protein DRN86_05825 [Candidatus Geothermarchaeota archaeon]|nr:MAG: hypothetical protein DRN86_05825 [Candidatus Geothermarchaeota archaeon]
MHTLGHSFIPPSIHEDGLRYHGIAPTLSLIYRHGAVETRAYNQVEVFKTATLFAKTEGIIPVPEPAHAIRAVIDEAIRCKRSNEEKTILFLLCGHGLLDLKVCEDYFSGKLKPYEYPEEKIRRLLKGYTGHIHG